MENPIEQLRATICTKLSPETRRCLHQELRAIRKDLTKLRLLTEKPDYQKIATDLAQIITALIGEVIFIRVKEGLVIVLLNTYPKIIAKVGKNEPEWKVKIDAF